MIHWFRKLLRRKAKPSTPFVYRRGWNAARWRASDSCVAEARAFYESEFGQRFLSVLHAEIPRGYAAVQPGQQLGRINGFIECLSVIDSLAELPPESTPEPEATFGVTEDENQP